MDFKEHLKRHLQENEIEALFDSLQKERTYSLVLNKNKMSEEKFISTFPKVEKHPFLPYVFYYKKEDYDFGKSYLFTNGLYYIMDASSCLTSYFLDPKDDDLILDFSSAPGGKSIYLNILNSKINLVSNDISYQRILTMSSNIERLGFSNILLTNFDFQKQNDFLYEKFDKIILDAPCSGSSMIRKNDEVLDSWSYQNVLRLQSLQVELLDIALSMLKKGGEMVYSTCSFSFEEDEGVIEKILEKRDDIELIELPHHQSLKRGTKFKETIYAFPFLYKGEGQFVCKIRKKGDLIKKESSSPKKISLPHDIKAFLEDNKLSFNSYHQDNDNIFGLNFDIPEIKNHIIRYGLNILEYKNKVIIPSFHLAHYLTSDTSIKLTQDEAKLYLKGETIKKPDLSLKNGFYLVSYNNLNLGYVKLVNGVLKNYYPKGLRRAYSSLDII